MKIKPHSNYFIVTTKSWEKFNIDEQHGVALKKMLLNKSHDFIQIGGVVYNRYEIVKVEPCTVIDDVDAYILSQKKYVRDKIEQYAKTNKIKRNSIDHVSRVVQAIHDNKV